jgi:hypothetical protein
MTPRSVALFGIGFSPLLVATFGLAPESNGVAGSSPLVYDPRYHTFDSWASLMAEQYAVNHLEIPSQNTDWKLWGNGLKAIDVFTNEAIPATDIYDDWQEWAQALLGAINPAVN